MKKVIRLNESDLTNLVKKIIKESSISEVGAHPKYKRSDLSPATALNERNGKEHLVIIDTTNTVVAIGPSIDFLKDKSKEEICRVADKLISDVFDLVESKLNEVDSTDFTDIKKLSFTCKISESIKRKKSIKENEESSRYMFFSNLQQMKRQCDMLLELDNDMIEGILENGHDWAQDHIAEAKNNMDQVFDFLMNETKKGDMENMNNEYEDYEY